MYKYQWRAYFTSLLYLMFYVYICECVEINKKRI